MTIGLWTIIISVVGVGLFTAWAYRDWVARWDVDLFYGIPVRFDFGASQTPSLRMELAYANEVITKAILEHYGEDPDLVLDLLDYWVEVVTPTNVYTPSVPQGKLPDGTPAAGSIRTERFMGIGPRHWVAVVSNENAGPLLIHEVLAHIVPAQVSGSASTHDLEGRYFDPKVKAIEYWAKGLLKELLHDDG